MPGVQGLGEGFRGTSTLFFFFWPHGGVACGSFSYLTGGSNSSPLQWKWGVLATGPPGEPPTPEHLWALGTWCSVSILRQALGGGYLTPLSYRREAGAQGSGPAGGQRAKTGDWHSERSEAPRPPGPCDSERPCWVIWGGAPLGPQSFLAASRLCRPRGWPACPPL